MGFKRTVISLYKVYMHSEADNGNQNSDARQHINMVCVVVLLLIINTRVAHMTMIMHSP